MSQKGWALHYAADELKVDRELVLASSCITEWTCITHYHRGAVQGRHRDCYDSHSNTWRGTGIRMLPEELSRRTKRDCTIISQ